MGKKNGRGGRIEYSSVDMESEWKGCARGGSERMGLGMEERNWAEPKDRGGLILSK